MAVTLTPAAVDRVRQYLSQVPGATGLRFGVRKSGCSGWAYVVDIATAGQPDDVVFEQDGVAKPRGHPRRRVERRLTSHIVNAARENQPEQGVRGQRHRRRS